MPRKTGKAQDLSADDRRVTDDVDFTRTGPGTLAGRYLRMFWQPVYRTEDLAKGQTVPIQIMSERFTLYRGEGGTPHVVDFRCPHRGTQLSVGHVEGDCIRCHYHGWKFEGSGRCVEQPGEDRSFAAKVKIRSYPAKDYLGFIFAYLGEGDPPPFRQYPDFERPGVLKVGTPELWPCNYFNRCENGVNGIHVPYTHRESARRAGRADLLIDREISAEETDYGIRENQFVPGQLPRYVHFHMPNTNQPRSEARIEGSLQDAAKLWADRLFWYVPTDDEHCLTFVLDYLPLTGTAAVEYQERQRTAKAQMTMSPNELSEAILRGELSLSDIDKATSTYYLFWIEDYLSLVGQGAIPDRTSERLGRSDAAVILLRKMWQRELGALRDGKPLKQWTSPAGLADQTIIRR
jgi:5,5'-dehydrodivanillate O-demethylase